MNRNIAIYLIVISFFQSGSVDKKDEYLNYNISLVELIDSLDVSTESLAIFIDKSDFKLAVSSGGKTIKEYPVVFGGNPVDDKLMEGDQCTPEGSFAVRDFYPHSSWSKFIWINYPNKSSWKKHNLAKKNGLISKEAEIGGEIGIHGVPEGYAHVIKNRVNWTLGCISMENEDINEIYQYLFKGMVVMISK